MICEIKPAPAWPESCDDKLDNCAAIAESPVMLPAPATVLACVAIFEASAVIDAVAPPAPATCAASEAICEPRLLMPGRPAPAVTREEICEAMPEIEEAIPATPIDCALGG